MRTRRITHIKQRISRNSLTPHIFYRVLAALIIIAGVLFYAQFQARNLIQGPNIVLTSPLETTQREHVIYLEGTAQNITTLSLNGKSIFTDEAGVFKEKLVLENGYTIITLTATDRFGRNTNVTRQFVYIPETTNI